MEHCAVSQILFSETYTVPAEQTSQQMFDVLPHGKSYSGRLLNAMANGYLVAVLESICACELQTHLDHTEETIVVSSMQCQHRAPILPGSLITIDGWVTGIGNHEASFWVRASDEQEIVCEGEIRFAIVKRAQIERKIQRKCEAIGRRQLFTAA
ncbi:MAG: thioesterase family protein [Burkholderiaceae bacterium]